MISFTITEMPKGGIRKVELGYIRFGNIFPQKFNKLAMEAMAKDIIKEAKFYARGPTGFLAESIRLGKVVMGTKRSYIQLLADARYAAAMERGFTPHLIPIEYIEQHYSTPGMIGMDTRDMGERPRAWVWVSRHHPYFAPAIEKVMSNLEQYNDRAFLSAVKASGLR